MVPNVWPLLVFPRFYNLRRCSRPIIHFLHQLLSKSSGVDKTTPFGLVFTRAQCQSANRIQWIFLVLEKNNRCCRTCDILYLSLVTYRQYGKGF